MVVSVSVWEGGRGKGGEGGRRSERRGNQEEEIPAPDVFRIQARAAGLCAVEEEGRERFLSSKGVSAS